MTFIIVSFVDKLSVAVIFSFNVKYDLNQAQLRRPFSGSAKCQDLLYASVWVRVQTSVCHLLALHRQKLQIFPEIKR
jgi:hypothetical protein